MTTFSRLFGASCALIALTSAVALGDDAAATALFDQAKVLYSQRADLKLNVQAIETLKQALAQAESDDLKYDILIFQARALYWKAFTLPGAEENNPGKVPAFEEGIAAADQALAISTEYADAYYVHALNRARWGLAIGKMKALFKLKELKGNLDKARVLDAKDGTAGEKLDGYGPNRVYGRLFFSLPPVAGGDNKKALNFLKPAFENAKNYAINVNYYAEVLADTGNKPMAREILRELLKNDANTYNPERAAESAIEFKNAAELLKKIGE